MSAETFAGLNVCPTPAGEKDTAAFSCSLMIFLTVPLKAQAFT